MTTTTEQCICGHAADRHIAQSWCSVGDCKCTAYTSWVTPEMALANAISIRDKNAAPFDVANTAVEEMRVLVGEFEVLVKDFTDANSPVISRAIKRCRLPLEAIVAKYDAAIKDAIK